jgi:NADP-dependent aldehyde dehydrogenase
LLVAGAVEAAVKACDLPAGVFSHLGGTGNAIGEALVSDPRIAAVGFTGSRAGGLAILKRAQARPVPIPVYAEMSSINPVILLPDVLDERAAALGAEFVASLTLGAGQFCTNPGLVVAIEGPGLDDFIDAAISAMVEVEAAPMLSERISEAYRLGVDALAAHGDVQTIARGRAGEGGRRCPAALFSTGAASFLADTTLGDEVFGATSLIVRCRDESELTAVLVALEGQLTATLHIAETDLSLAARLLPALELKAGRILVNGWPTGVEVSHAMVHGGPFPATSDARSTSVGTLAIDRFLRPVCYQNLPEALLPREAGWSPDDRM